MTYLDEKKYPSSAMQGILQDFTVVLLVRRIAPWPDIHIYFLWKRVLLSHSRTGVS